MNGTICFFLTSPVFLFILIIGVFFIWRERGARNNPAFVQGRVRFGDGGAMIYAGISIDGRTDLHIIRNGALTGQRYRDEILKSIVVPYDAAIGNDFMLMDDNCRLCRAHLVDDFFFEEGIIRLDWPDQRVLRT